MNRQARKALIALIAKNGPYELANFRNGWIITYGKRVGLVTSGKLR